MRHDIRNQQGVLSHFPKTLNLILKRQKVHKPSALQIHDTRKNSKSEPHFPDMIQEISKACSHVPETLNLIWDKAPQTQQIHDTRKNSKADPNFQENKKSRSNA